MRWQQATFRRLSRVVPRSKFSLLGRFHWAIVLLELPIALGLIGGTLGWFGALLLLRLIWGGGGLGIPQRTLLACPRAHPT